MDKLITTLKKTYPSLIFTPSDTFYWSPESQEIFYKENTKGLVYEWALIHEVGHALLSHKHYDSDFRLLKLEIEAWQKAKEIASSLGLKINEDHIEDCLDTYRDWLHGRSVCPRCSNKSLQQSDFSHYQCFNCHKRWRVTTSRFCRTYRISDDTLINQPIFI